MTKTTTILILGLGNMLFSDDGIGVHLVNRLAKNNSQKKHLKFVDGGTVGLNLLTELDDTYGIIAIDAAEIDKPAGFIQIFEGLDMDTRLAAKKRTPHEVTLADLMSTAVLTGIRPDNRALVGIQPEDIDWGDKPTETLMKSMDKAESIILALADKWTAQHAPKYITQELH